VSVIAIPLQSLPRSQETQVGVGCLYAGWPSLSYWRTIGIRWRWIRCLLKESRFQERRVDSIVFIAFTANELA
jgi:hypothetical protein